MANPDVFSESFWTQPRSKILGGLTPQQALLLYVTIPVLLGFLAGWPQSGRAAQWPKMHAVGFWTAMSVGSWWINGIFTRLVAPPLRAARLPLWSILLIGVVVASPLSDLYIKSFVHLTYWAFPWLPLDRPMPVFEWHAEQFLRTHLYGYLIWPLINLACFHFLMMPRYGFTPATEPRPALARPSESASFIARLPAHLGVDILALEAEQHYLRVHTANGSDLILYRLSDAVRELGVRGTQVHRSFWVAAEAITKVCGSSAAPKLLLRNGMEVPVSRSYRLLAQQAGLI